jgi:hypothetical protein
MNITQEISPGHQCGCHSDKLGEAPRHECGPLLVKTGQKIVLEGGELVSKQMVEWYQPKWS